MSNHFLDLYFERIKYSQSPKVNLQTLRDLHAVVISDRGKIDEPSYDI